MLGTIDENDQKDVVNASARVLILEIQKLAALTQEFNTKVNEMDASEILQNTMGILAQNSAVTISLSSLVMAHLGATNLLEGEIKLHS